MRQCTVEYTQRLEDAAMAMAAAQLVQLSISNSNELLSIHPRIKHQWTLQVGLESQPDCCLPNTAALPDLIKHVRFGLKPAFMILSDGSHSKPVMQNNQSPFNYVEVGCSPFQVTVSSHVTCMVPIIITWQDWVGQSALRLEHQLVFRSEGSSWDYNVDLRAAVPGFYKQERAELDIEAERNLMDLQSNHIEREVRKRPGTFSKAWMTVCKHLPKMHKPIG